MSKKKEVNEIEEKVFFDRKQILKVEDIEIVEHYVEQWKTYVLIKVMTSKERQKFQAQLRSKKRQKFQAQLQSRKSGAEDTVPENMAEDTVPENMMESLVVMSVVDPDNRTAPMFTMPDIALLSEKNSQALASIFAKSAEINGLTAGAVDKAAKN